MRADAAPADERSSDRAVWRAMGSRVTVTVVGDEAVAALAYAQDRIDELEQRWSRFLPDSEVSQLNREADGRPHTVSDDTLLLVTTALDARDATGGHFDATVGAAVLAAGYDRPFPFLRSPAHPSVSARTARAPSPVHVDPDRCTVTLERGTVFDPGGIGKGLAADLVVDELIAGGAVGACVSVGGDVRARGTSPDGDDRWTISIADPFDEGDQEQHDLLVLALADGAVTTSSVLRRRWETATGPAHHVIDPATGLPAVHDLLAITVVAANGATAEAISTASLAGGASVAREVVQRLDAAALLFGTGGAMSVAGPLERFTAGART